MRQRCTPALVTDADGYALELLMHLPLPAERAALTDALTAGLRLCCAASQRATLDAMSIRGSDTDEGFATERIRARAAAAGWQALFEHVRNGAIALRLRDLEDARPSDLDIMLVREAEHYVDSLLLDVEARAAQVIRKP